MRCVHEASLHEENSFITLTYSDDTLPEGGTLVKQDFQKFMKRLRKEYDGTRIRFYHCGEYGEKSGRPHYHGLLFGLDFHDKFLHTTRGDNKVFRSPTLERLWQAGHSEVGSVTFKSAAYCARYVTKKFKGTEEQVRNYYGHRVPEYATMSRRPGIGKEWYDKFKEEVLANDSVIINGREVKPPRFYDALLAEDYAQRFLAKKGLRKRSVVYEETSDVRLDVKRQVAVSRLNLFERRSI